MLGEVINAVLLLGYLSGGIINLKQPSTEWNNATDNFYSRILCNHLLPPPPFFLTLPHFFPGYSDINVYFFLPSVMGRLLAT